MAKNTIFNSCFLRFSPKISLPIILGLFLSNTIIAQDFNNFKPLTAQGKMPAEFITLSSEKYSQEIDKVKQESKEDKRFEKKAKKEFTIKNSFDMKDYLFSGRIIFNDPISLYINKVADEILKTEPELRAKVKFMTIRSSDVNAFATHEGLIFVNEGMIAHLESEAQLAFMLCHELVHYKKKHVMNSYVEGVKIEKGKTEFKTVSASGKFSAKNRYSRELETEADMEGFEMFLKTKYSVKPVTNFFRVLQYSYLPFDDIVFEKSFLETPTFKLPDTYLLSILNGIVASDEDNEEKSTHPSLKTRKAYIAGKTRSIANQSDKKEFIVSESEFYNVRKIARYDIITIKLLDADYTTAFYDAYMLLQEDKNSLYLQKCIAKSLYAMAKYANASKKNDVLQDYEKMEGNSQQVFHLFSKLKAREINAIALKYCWNLSVKYPGHKDLKAYTDDLFKELVFENFPDRKQFSALPFGVKPNFVDTNHQEQPVFQHIKLNPDTTDPIQYSDTDTILNEDNFIRYVFVDELVNVDFQKKFDSLSAAKITKDLAINNYAENKRKRKAGKREKRLIRRKGHALGIDKIVLINPFYQKKDLRKKAEEKYFASENAELRLNQQIGQNARIAGLDVEVINDLNLTGTDIQKYNDMAFMTMWLQERVRHLDSDVEILNIETEYIETLVKRYNTPYFSWMGVIGLTDRKDDVATKIGETIILPFMLPFTVYYIATPNYDTYYIYLLFDITTGKPQFVQAKYLDAKDSQTIINMNMYDSFYQIKSSRKK